MRFRLHPVVIVSWIMMLCALVCITFMPSARPVPLKKPFIYFPFKIGEWEGREKPVLDRVVDELGADDIVQREYTNRKGDKCELYFSYYEYTSFRGEKAPHVPEVCWVGKGWTFKELGEEDIELRSKEQPYALVRKKLARREKKDGEEKVLLFYLLKMNEKYVGGNRAKFISNFRKDIFLQRKTSAFTLQLSTDVGEEGIEYKEKQMREFLVRVLSILEDGFLP